MLQIGCCLILLSSLVGCEILNLRVPAINLRQAEPTMCVSFDLDMTKTLLIKGFVPKAFMENVNHISLVGFRADSKYSFLGSEKPRALSANSDADVRPCGTMSASSSDEWQSVGPQTLFVWGRNATSFMMPEGVAMPVGRGTGIEKLVMQLHYHKHGHGHQVEAETSWPEAGLDVLYEHDIGQNRDVAGVLSLHAGGIILPHTRTVLESSCRLMDNADIESFAFLVHTHDLGTSVSTWKVDGDEQRQWRLIGRRDPQLPQAFVALDRKERLSADDIVSVRCTMSSSRDTVTVTGATREHEMCAAYIMYRTKDKRVLERPYCIGGHAAL